MIFYLRVFWLLLRLLPQLAGLVEEAIISLAVPRPLTLKYGDFTLELNNLGELRLNQLKGWVKVEKFMDNQAGKMKEKST